MPRDSAVDGDAPGAAGCDLAEIAAPVEPPSSGAGRALRRRADRIPTLHFDAGGPTAKRDLNVLIGKNVQAGRIMAGVTFSEPGNWTSWPPHEHAAMLEEAYLYIDMPAPAFGVQLVYTNAREPEVATIVREGDVVLMPQGYHPNVAAPGGVHQLPVDDGGPPRRRGPPVRRRQRPARLRGDALRARRRQGEAVTGTGMTSASSGTAMPLDRFRLDGKVALVTGASRGLGAAMAVALAGAGADVVLHASERPAAATADAIAPGAPAAARSPSPPISPIARRPTG